MVPIAAVQAMHAYMSTNEQVWLTVSIDMYVFLSLPEPCVVKVVPCGVSMRELSCRMLIHHFLSCCSCIHWLNVISCCQRSSATMNMNGSGWKHASRAIATPSHAKSRIGGVQQISYSHNVSSGCDHIRASLQVPSGCCVFVGCCET